MTWNVDGTLREIPCEWDFPQIDPAEFCLPEAKVGSWGGFVFVNVDPEAAPLAEYIEDLPLHFADSPLDERDLTAHLLSTVPFNWQVEPAAFLKSAEARAGKKESM